MPNDPVDLAKASIKPPVDPKNFRVFVFGPALDPMDAVAAPTTGTNGHDNLVEHARYLRFRTKVELEAEGFTVDYGETSAVTTFWSERYKAEGVGRTEMLHALLACGAVVIFPSSVGSIAELALVARDGAIAEKTLAIVHNAYQNAQSFFRLGVVELFEDYNGRSSYVSYEDHEACVKYAVRYVKRRYNRVMNDLQDIEYKTAKYRGGVFQNVT